MKREILAAAVALLLASGTAAAAEPKKISSDFATFAGSPANADSLVGGLRSGSEITLSSIDAAGVTTTRTFTPATAKMGNGNVYISLALAKQQLANVGITQPTTQQIQASLIGGDVTVNGQTTTLKGVTTLRSEGMGWGKIAQTLGFKLGPVMSAMKSGNPQVSAPTTAGAGAARGNSGITTAAGSTNSGHGNALGRGITTGAGSSAAQGQGNAYGRGITTGTSGAPGQSSAAGSQGKGAGKGG